MSPANRVFVYDDARAREFEPFALTRPISTLVAGSAPLAERLTTALAGALSGAIVAPHLADHDDGVPSVIDGTLPAGSVVANSRFAPARHFDWAKPNALGSSERHSSPEASVWRADGRIVAVRLARDLPVAELDGGKVDLASLVPGQSAAHVVDLDGWWMDEVWDLVRHLPAILSDDLRRSAEVHSEAKTLPPGAIVFGTHGILVEDGAIVEPHVIFDASAGPIHVAHGAKVHAFSRLNGPCYVGPMSMVLGGEISATSIGPVCKVRGEVSNTIFAGYANKGHDGFVGHSYLGHWVNLGANTITSNLKNTYGTVSLSTPRGVRDTGLQFLGTLFGDHAKTGIGLCLTTGTVLGAGANIYGHMPPKVVPPFAWGDSPPYSTYLLDKFLEVAERMMSRRHVTLSERTRRQLSAAYEARWTIERGSEP